MAQIHDFRQLRVYSAAFDAAAEVHTLTAGFPVDEKFGLTDQLRRATRSVCANLAEAWRRRRSAKHFVAKLSDADAEAAEATVWLDFALRFGYLQSNKHRELIDGYDHISRQLTIMIRTPDQWVRAEP